MKAGKILIVMIFAALGFTANAQRGVYASNNNTSVSQYIYALDLTKSQVRDWSEVNRYYEDEFQYVRNDRNLSNRARSSKMDRLYYQRDQDVRGILSNRQYRTFSGLRSYNSYYRPSARFNRNNSRYNRYSRSNSYRRGFSRNSCSRY